MVVSQLVIVPNLLSFLRILLSVPIVYALSCNSSAYNWLAFGLCLVAVATDLLDGLLARRLGSVSTLGKYIDPIADKVCIGVLAAYLAFFRGNMPEWLAIIVIAKDALILIGAFILMTRGIVVQADGPGKYSVCIVTVVFLCFVLDFNRAGTWAIGPAILFALYSTWFYYQKYLALLERESGWILRFGLPLVLSGAGAAAALHALFPSLF